MICFIGINIKFKSRCNALALIPAETLLEGEELNKFTRRDNNNTVGVKA